MSTMRNAVRRRTHKERGQPGEREKWGLLEKHKDYAARARDFNTKKSKLRALRQKVLKKHPDEFYFGILSRRGPSTAGKDRTGTLNGDRGNKVLSQDAVRLLKTQDMAYLRTMRNQTTKAVESLKRTLIGIGGERGKILYVDNDEEQVQKLGDYGREDGTKEVTQELKSRESRKAEARLELEQKRLKALVEAEVALDLQRARMAKSPSVGGVNKRGFKFKVRQRKR